MNLLAIVGGTFLCLFCSTFATIDIEISQHRNDEVEYNDIDHQQLDDAIDRKRQRPHRKYKDADTVLPLSPLEELSTADADSASTSKADNTLNTTTKIRKKSKSAKKSKSDNTHSPSIHTTYTNTTATTSKSKKSGKNNRKPHPPTNNNSGTLSPISSGPSHMPSISTAPSSVPSNNPSLSGKPSSMPSVNPSISGAPSSQPSQSPSKSNAPSSTPSEPFRLIPSPGVCTVTDPNNLGAIYTCLRNEDWGVEDDTKWNIDFSIETVDPTYADAYVKARHRWMKVIPGNLEKIIGRDEICRDFDICDPCSNNFPHVIDDLHICAQDIYIGEGGVLGVGQPGLARDTDGTVYAGYMAFDSADIPMLIQNGIYDSLVEHEMGVSYLLQFLV